MNKSINILLSFLTNVSYLLYMYVLVYVFK